MSSFTGHRTILLSPTVTAAPLLLVSKVRAPPPPSCPHQDLVVWVPPTAAPLAGWHVPVVRPCTFPITGDVDNLVTCMLAVCMSFVKCLITSAQHFNRAAFSLPSCKNSLSRLGLRLLSDTGFVSIFSLSCAFHFLKCFIAALNGLSGARYNKCDQHNARTQSLKGPAGKPASAPCSRVKN